MADDGILRVARGALHVFLIANLVVMVGFVLAILLSFGFAAPLEARLLAKYGPSLDAGSVMQALRAMMLVSFPAGVALHLIFSRLLAMVATVQDGDPFTAANAQRLQTIGWALLVLQALDLLLGVFAAWFAALHVDFLTWSPSFGGWIATLMVLVLARVFRRGAAMRDDLAMTI